MIFEPDLFSPKRKNQHCNHQKVSCLQNRKFRQILNEQNYSSLIDNSEVDIDDAIFVVEAQTVNEEIASLENSLNSSYVF